MSRVTVYIIDPTGNVVPYKEASNAYGCAPVIWSKMSERYLGKDFSFFEPDKIWPIASDPAVDLQDRITMGFTFDSAFVKKENIPRLIEALRSFLRGYGDGSSGTIHIIVSILYECCSRQNDLGVCFRQTSVIENLWQVLLPAKEEYCDREYRPFNILTDYPNKTKMIGKFLAYELFEEIDSGRPASEWGL